MIFVTDTADNVVNVSGDRFYHVEKFQIKCKTVKFSEKKFTFQQTKCFCVKKYKYIVEKITNITFEQNGATIHAE